MAKLNVSAPDNWVGAGFNSFSNKFEVSSTVEAQQLLFYRVDGSAPLPTAWSLTHAVAGDSLNQEIAPELWHPVGGNWWAYGGPPFVGWTIELVSGSPYFLTVYFEFSTSRIGQTSLTPSPGSPATWLGSYTESGNHSQPASLVSTDSAWCVDIGWSSFVDEEAPTGPTDPSGENHATQADLAAWLQDGNPVLRLDGLPKLAYDLLVLESAALGLANAKLDDLSSAIETALGPGGDFLLGALRLYLDNLKADVDNTLAVADGLLGERVEAIYQQGADLPAAINPVIVAAGRDTVPVGDPGWHSVFYGAFEGTFVYDLPCDYVSVDVATWGEGRRINTFGGITFFESPWWWCPLRGGVVPERYQTSMATNAGLYEAGRRMGGVLVKLPPDFTGSYEVWIYDGIPDP